MDPDILVKITALTLAVESVKSLHKWDEVWKTDSIVTRAEKFETFLKGNK